MDTSPITARSLQKPYHIKADEFERAYKDFLSGYRTWKELSHAEDWLVFSAFVILYLYNGRRAARGRTFYKWFFYAFYPAHLLVLGLLRLAV